MSSKDTLDFVVIGAQKAGTTSLFRHMYSHPQVLLPPEKEAPFFNWEERYRLGWEWYLNEFFADAPPDKLWGTVTPQYMCYPGVAERIARQLPHAKLIAILRDPIERAYSHYRMSVRRRQETRTFDEVVRVSLDDPESPRHSPTEANSYIAWGEYGRILSDFRRYFRAANFLVLYTHDLAQDPLSVLHTVCLFLEISEHEPGDLDLYFHVGGDREKLAWVSTVMGLRPVRVVWRRVRGRRGRALAQRFKQWNIIRETRAPDAALSPHHQRRLERHYLSDANLLTQLGIESPWVERYQLENGPGS